MEGLATLRPQEDSPSGCVGTGGSLPLSPEQTLFSLELRSMDRSKGEEGEHRENLQITRNPRLPDWEVSILVKYSHKWSEDSSSLSIPWSLLARIQKGGRANKADT